MIPPRSRSTRWRVDSFAECKQCTTNTESYGIGINANLLDVVVTQRAAIFELLAREDETLLIRRDAFFVLDLALHIIDGIGGLDLEGDGLASKRFYETTGGRWLVPHKE